MRIAHTKTTPEKFVKKTTKLAIMTAMTTTATTLFLFGKTWPLQKLLATLPLVFIASIILAMAFLLQSPKATIRKRQRDIDKEVLFAGRYILIKVESGNPLVNTIMDASKTYGVAAKYFKEIADDINTGTPVEEALENARTYNASPSFRKILWQTVVALKTGTDISDAMRNVIKAIAADQIIEIKKYAKKLNSILLFYMILACVVPSLGLTMFLIISGFLNLSISNTALLVILFFTSVMQIAFIIMVKSARPLVQL